jgi:hypothetical protein
LEGNAGGAIERREPPSRLSVTWEYGGKVSWVDLSRSAEGEEITPGADRGKTQRRVTAQRRTVV